MKMLIFALGQLCQGRPVETVRTESDFLSVEKSLTPENAAQMYYLTFHLRLLVRGQKAIGK